MNWGETPAKPLSSTAVLVHPLLVKDGLLFLAISRNCLFLLSLVPEASPEQMKTHFKVLLDIN